MWEHANTADVFNLVSLGRLSVDEAADIIMVRRLAAVPWWRKALVIVEALLMGYCAGGPRS